MDISKNIKAVREERKISQSEIARRLGVEPTNYPRMEKRGNKLTIEQLEKIAKALGVTAIELMTGEAQKEKDDERIIELERRIKELEDRIKDKESLLFSYKDRLATVDYNFRISHTILRGVFFTLKESLDKNSMNIDEKVKDYFSTIVDLLERPLNISDKVLEFNIPYVSDSSQYKEVIDNPYSIPTIQEYNRNKA